MYDPLRVVVPLGLTNTEGAFWRRQRHFISPVFHGANMDAMLPLIASHVSKHMQEWKRLHEPVAPQVGIGEVERELLDQGLAGLAGRGRGGRGHGGTSQSVTGGAALAMFSG